MFDSSGRPRVGIVIDYIELCYSRPFFISIRTQSFWTNKKYSNFMLYIIYFTVPEWIQIIQETLIKLYGRRECIKSSVSLCPFASVCTIFVCKFLPQFFLHSLPGTLTFPQVVDFLHKSWCSVLPFINQPSLLPLQASVNPFLSLEDFFLFLFCCVLSPCCVAVVFSISPKTLFFCIFLTSAFHWWCNSLYKTSRAKASSELVKKMLLIVFFHFS